MFNNIAAIEVLKKCILCYVKDWRLTVRLLEPGHLEENYIYNKCKVLSVEFQTKNLLQGLQEAQTLFGKVKANIEGLFDFNLYTNGSSMLP